MTNQTDLVQQAKDAYEKADAEHRYCTHSWEEVNRRGNRVTYECRGCGVKETDYEDD